MEYSTKTQKYRKIMKPLLERQRRARINKCLDQLKDLLNDCLKNDNNNDEILPRLEKADILEYTVQYLRKTKIEKSSSEKNLIHISTTLNSFRNGYVYAANEISKVMSSTRGIDISLGTKLMSHLGYKLNCLQQQQTDEIQETKIIGYNQQKNIETYSPLNIETQNGNISTLTTISPTSSGYCSDYYSSSSSNSPVSCDEYYVNSLNNIWRPW